MRELSDHRETSVPVRPGTWGDWHTGGRTLGIAGAKQFVLELPGRESPRDERRESAPLQRAQVF